MMLTLVPLQLHLTDLSLPIPAILSSSDLGLQCCLASLYIQKYVAVNVIVRTSEKATWCIRKYTH